MNLIQIYREGREWRAMIGRSPDEGIVGRADTPVRALSDLVFRLNITPWKFKNASFKQREEE